MSKQKIDQTHKKNYPPVHFLNLWEFRFFAGGKPLKSSLNIHLLTSKNNNITPKSAKSKI